MSNKCFINLQTKSEPFGTVLLRLYRHTDSLLRSIDNKVLAKIGKETGLFYAPHKRLEENLNAIIDISERKKVLLRLKFVTEEVLLKLPKKYAKILILRFIKGFTLADSAFALGINSIHARSLQSYAMGLFYKQLQKEGFSEPVLWQNYLRHKWMRQTLQNLGGKECDKMTDSS